MVVMHVRNASANKAKLAIERTACNFALLCSSSEENKKQRSVDWSHSDYVLVVYLFVVSFDVVACCCRNVHAVCTDTLSIGSDFFALSSKAWISYTPWCDWDFISPFSLFLTHTSTFHSVSHPQFPLILWVMQTCSNVCLFHWKLNHVEMTLWFQRLFRWFAPFRFGPEIHWSANESTVANE